MSIRLPCRKSVLSGVQLGWVLRAVAAAAVVGNAKSVHRVPQLMVTVTTTAGCRMLLFLCKRDVSETLLNPWVASTYRGQK